MTLFKEADKSKTSMRRVMGAIVILFALVLAGVDTFTENKVNDTIWIAMFTGGVSLIVSTVIPKRKGRDHHNESI